MDGEILPLTFPRSRISVAFDKKKAVTFWSAPLKCGPRSVVYSVEGLCKGQRRQSRTLTGQLVHKGNSRQREAIDQKMNHRMRSQEVWRKTRGVAYDTAWPFIQDRGCERPACSVISCWFWRQDSHREEERTDLLRTRLSTQPSIASFVRNKPSHDFWHMKLYCFLPFQSLGPHSPPTHFSVLQLQDFPEHIMPFHIAMSLSIELHFRLSYCNKERLQQTVLVFLLKQPRGAKT